MSKYRLRAEGELLVLQVLVERASSMYDNYRHAAEWRDAKIEDIPVGDVFGSQTREVTVYRAPDGEILQG